MLKKKLTLSALATLFAIGALNLLAPTLATAQSTSEADEDYISYDRIVDDLQSESKRQTRETNRMRSKVSNLGPDPFENVWIHAGVGFAQTAANLELPAGGWVHMAARGIQAAIGIDILGPNLAAEGTVRNFGETEDSASKVQLKEFDLKIFAKHREGRFGVRGGAGLSARYMTAKTPTDVFEVTTPASVLQLGGDLYITKSISVGLDLSARTAMISETFDRTSYDGTIRLDTHF